MGLGDCCGIRLIAICDPFFDEGPYDHVEHEEPLQRLFGAVVGSAGRVHLSGRIKFEHSFERVVAGGAGAEFAVQAYTTVWFAAFAGGPGILVLPEEGTFEDGYLYVQFGSLIDYAHVILHHESDVISVLHVDALDGIGGIGLENVGDGASI